LLAKVKWLKPIRLACDTQSQKDELLKAVTLLRWHNATPRTYSVYTIIMDDMEESIDRIKFVKGIGCDPFAQPYRDEEGTKPEQWQEHLARFVNHKAIFRSIAFEDYK
jgi:hypothetical protein